MIVFVVYASVAAALFVAVAVSIGVIDARRQWRLLRALDIDDAGDARPVGVAVAVAWPIALGIVTAMAVVLVAAYPFRLVARGLARVGAHLATPRPKPIPKPAPKPRIVKPSPATYREPPRCPTCGQATQESPNA